MNEYLDIISRIAVIITASIAVLQYIKIRKVKKENKDLEEKVDLLASTGVAVGYYYNFIVKVFDKLREHKLSIEIKKDNSEETEKIQNFYSDDVELKIIMPEDLKVKSMTAALKKMRIHRKGNILSPGSKRDFSINFMYLEDNKIAIIDFPTALNAVREYMKKKPKFATLLDSNNKFRESPEWNEQEKRELENFKDTLNQLMEDGRLDEGQTETSIVNESEIPMSEDGK